MESSLFKLLQDKFDRELNKIQLKHSVFFKENDIRNEIVLENREGKIYFDTFPRIKKQMNIDAEIREAFDNILIDVVEHAIL